MSAVGRSLTVETAVQAGPSGRSLQVSVVSRHGCTTVRAVEDLSGTAGGLFAGLGGGGAAAVGAVLAAFTANATHSAPSAIAALVATAVVFMGSARWLFQRESRQKQQALEALVRTVTERVLSLPEPR